jgi:hypothetical protein
VPGSAEARVPVKAARFLHCVPCSSAPLRGSLRLAFDSPLFRLGLERGIKAAVGAGSQSKGNNMTTETTTSRPTHRIFAVTKDGKKKFWQPIGALWAHTDGKGFNQRLDYLPLNNAEIVIREVGDAEANGNGGAQ